MKSKSSLFIVISVIVLVIAALIYLFGRGDSPSATTQVGDSGLVSTNTGTAAGLASASTTGNTAGQQVVTLLRNLSAIKLDDAVFRNPSFALLEDSSVALAPVTNQGRRNPFAAVGTDANASSLVAPAGAGTQSAPKSLGSIPDTHTGAN